MRALTLSIHPEAHAMTGKHCIVMPPDAEAILSGDRDFLKELVRHVVQGVSIRK